MRSMNMQYAECSIAGRHGLRAVLEVSEIQQEFRLDGIQQCAMGLEVGQQVLIAT